MELLIGILVLIIIFLLGVNQRNRRTFKSNFRKKEDEAREVWVRRLDIEPNLLEQIKELEASSHRYKRAITKAESEVEYYRALCIDFQQEVGELYSQKSDIQDIAFAALNDVGEDILPEDDEGISKEAMDRICNLLGVPTSILKAPQVPTYKTTGSVIEQNNGTECHFECDDLPPIERTPCPEDNKPIELHCDFAIGEPTHVDSIHIVDDPVLAQKLWDMCRNLQGQPASFQCHNDGLKHRGETKRKCPKFCGNSNLCPRA